MKRFMKLTAVVGILSASQLVAMDGYDRCGGCYAYVEALYWKPTHCPIPYATQDPGDNENPRIVREFLVKNDYEWGLRFGIGYTNDCFLVQASYLWIQPSNVAKTGDRPNLIIQGAGSSNSASISTKLTTRYQNVDLRVGKFLKRSCDCALYVYGNARYVDLKLENHTTGKPTDPSEVDSRHLVDTSFDGVGLGVGLGGQFDICSGFGISGRFGFMGIIGDTRVDHDELNHGSSADQLTVGREPSTTGIVPGIEFRLGVNYTYTCGCWDLFGEIGYEFDYYRNALRFSTTNEQSNDLANISCQSIGFGGPYIKVAIGF